LTGGQALKRPGMVARYIGFSFSAPHSGLRSPGLWSSLRGVQRVSEVDGQCLEDFPRWLQALDEDVAILARTCQSEHAQGPAKAALITCLNLLLRSVDLSVDKIAELAYLEIALTLRAAAAEALREQPDLARDAEELVRLAQEGALVRKFLGEGLDEAQLDALRRARAIEVRGRSVANLLEHSEQLDELTEDVDQWREQYAAPGFSAEHTGLIKLHAFMRARLER